MTINLEKLFTDIVEKVESFDLYSRSINYNMYDTKLVDTNLIFTLKETPTVSFEKRMPQMMILGDYDILCPPNSSEHKSNFIDVEGFTIVNISDIENIQVLIKYNTETSILHYTNEGVFENHVKLNCGESQ